MPIDSFTPEPQEFKQTTKVVTDESGKPVCEFDLEDCGVVELRPYSYEDPEGGEKFLEHVYVTDDSGQIIPEANSTKKEARDNKQRYLIVTALIFHGDNFLLQHRGAHKDLDADKESASAHGVAKEIRDETGQRIEDRDAVALVNTALEINEELRYGSETKPFTIKIWHGTKDELFQYAATDQINDADTIYLIPEELFNDGYPLGTDAENPRTRSVSTGYIFCENTPQITFNPNAIIKVEWQQPNEVINNPNITEDLKQCIKKLDIGK